MEWRPKKAKADSPEQSASVNMVFVLPEEFHAPTPPEPMASFIDSVGDIVQLDIGPRPVVFEKPREKTYKHLKPLYLKGYINGKPVNRMLVDTGAAVNIMPYSVMRRLGHNPSELIKTSITLNDFNGQTSEAQGVLNVDLRVGNKSMPTAFFVTDSKGTYTVILGRDWIYANCCIPSSMHQCIIQWDGDEVEIVRADDTADISIANPDLWESEDQEPLSGKCLDGCERIEITRNGLVPVMAEGLTE